MNFKEECLHCGTKKKPEIIKGIEICKECKREWEPYEPYFDDASGHDY